MPAAPSRRTPRRFIDYAEFTSAVARNPNIIKALTLSVNELAAAAGGGSAH